ncbi:photosynthetic NDH subunit of lumenal location 4, chloroplastic-like protein [Cinnamomum micranthum f. kanehirae]|uniref:peptidylprolyl isomerase n=1 Tax=Cinnamomum micranthum f. kanehirae TaxID=337451 RepID=A0A3S3M7D6_9MAGN|nr:photosynthetic NDH subunit of lumenal location 4, chloroplastic-like protein [Cinnamomum micranthum f. kanehirae]
MALSTLLVSSTTSKPLHLLQKPISIPSFKSIQCYAKPSPSSSSSANADSKASLELVSSKRWGFFDMGIGLLAASMLVLTPLEANATRIEYYATVGEPNCDLNFVRSGLGYCDVKVGTGVEPPLGELINIHYTARFGDGRVFDSSYKRARPLTLRIGLGKVIRGLDQGILGGDGVPPMLVGGKRKLHIPPELAYGPDPAGCFSGDCNIPANATLLYDILFVGIYK